MKMMEMSRTRISFIPNTLDSPYNEIYAITSNTNAFLLPAVFSNIVVDEMLKFLKFLTNLLPVLPLPLHFLFIRNLLRRIGLKFS